MFRRGIAAALMLLGSGFLSAQPSLQEQVDAIFAPLDRDDAPGCAVGVMRAGELAYARGYGLANLELGVPLTARSVFRVASLSKQFTATAVLLLAEQGHISLDDDIRTHLPDLVDYGEAVTIRAMLGHVSGIMDYEAELPNGNTITQRMVKNAAGGPFRLGREDYLTSAEFYDVARRIPLAHPPFTRFEYSNTPYLLFATLVERKTGLSLRAFSQRYIFGPLGMKYSFFLDDLTELVPNRASGYTALDGGGYANDMTNLPWVGDGGLHTSIEDFSRWDRQFYQPKLGRDPGKLLAALNTPNSRLGEEGWQYANGQFLRETAHGMQYAHTGSWLGYRAYYSRYPEQALSVVVLCNDVGLAPKDYGERLMGELLP